MHRPTEAGAVGPLQPAFRRDRRLLARTLPCRWKPDPLVHVFAGHGSPFYYQRRFGSRRSAFTAPTGNCWDREERRPPYRRLPDEDDAALDVVDNGAQGDLRFHGSDRIPGWQARARAFEGRA